MLKDLKAYDQTVIGLTMYGLNDQKHYQSQWYVDCVIAAGGVPMVSLPGDIKMVDLVNGILLIRR